MLKMHQKLIGGLDPLEKFTALPDPLAGLQVETTHEGAGVAAEADSEGEEREGETFAWS